MPDSKPNVLFVLPGPSYKPETEYFQRQFKKLSTHLRGHVFTTSTNRKEIIIDDLVFHSVRSGAGIISKSRFASFCIYQALKMRFKGDRLELVCSYDPLTTGMIACLISLIHGAKFVAQVNGVYTSKVVWESRSNNVFARLKAYLPSIIMPAVIKQADAIKLLFDGQISMFSELLDRKLIERFPNFVNVEDFKNTGDEKEILFVGFPFKLKGCDILIEAFKKVSVNHPEWKLKILGWYPDLTELESAIDGHPSIHHHPAVHRHEVPEHIGKCGFLVLPSRSEAMGRVLVESMAAGKARIGSNVGGIPTVINDGEDGFLVEPENIDALAEKLDLLMSNDELRKTLGARGQQRAKTEFSEDRYARNIADFFSRVLAI